MYFSFRGIILPYAILKCFVAAGIPFKLAVDISMECIGSKIIF